VTDLLEGAPAPVTEALAYILLGKLFRRPVPRVYAHRYRLYLNRRDMRRQMHLIRQIRGRKFVSGPAGVHHDLGQIFEELKVGDFTAEPRLTHPLEHAERAQAERKKNQQVGQELLHHER